DENPKATSKSDFTSIERAIKALAPPREPAPPPKPPTPPRAKPREPAAVPQKPDPIDEPESEAEAPGGDGILRDRAWELACAQAYPKSNRMAADAWRLIGQIRTAFDDAAMEAEI